MTALLSVVEEKRFFAKVAKRSDGCWVWTGAGDAYGKVRVRGRLWRAHRLAYLAFRGDLPEGTELDHLCRNTRCVNPEHLEPVSHRENVRRGVGPVSRSMRDDVCFRGHRFTKENTSLGSDGYRRCRKCVNAGQRNRLRGN